MDDDELITNWGLVVEGFSRAMHHLESHLDDSVDSTSFNVLLRLERSPGHRLQMTQLAHEVELTSGGFTKVADRLCVAGYAKRVACEHDRRVTWMELTELGMATAVKAKLLHAGTLRTMVEQHLSAPELEQIGAIMRKLRDNLS